MTRSIFYLTYNFLYQLKKAVKIGKPIIPALKYTSAYFKTNRNKIENPLESRLPWITHASVDQLEALLKPSMIGFEFGSGGSTLFLASRISQVISVEHDKEWKNLLDQKLIENKIDNVELILIEPEKGTDSNYGTRYGKQWLDFTFYNYASQIDKYPDNHFDYISIDGRARNACLKHAWPKLKKSGYLLFDNADRVGYQESTQFLKPYLYHQFYGPAVHYLSFTETHIYQKQ